MAAYFSVLQPGDRILGHEPRPRWPPDPRHGPQLQRQAVRGVGLRRAQGHRTDRLRRARGDRQGGPAQAHRRRRQRLPEVVGLRAHGGHRARHRRAAVRRHGPHRRARGRRRPPEPVPARRHRHDDDAQDAARPAGRADLRPARAARRGGSGRLPGAQGPARGGDRQDGLPGRPGRAADARHRRQGRRVQAGGGRAVPRGTAAHGRECRGAGADARRPGRPGRQRRHRQPPDARRRDAARA